MRVEYTGRFLRSYKKLIVKDSKVRTKVILLTERLKENPYHPSLRTHKVNTSELGEVFSSRVTGDLRVLWIRKDKDTILFLLIGGHEGKGSVYN
jgi:mRNA-degrading endonuclease YafQ of YafQ-DinJ toxin-antitoxin module